MLDFLDNLDLPNNPDNLDLPNNLDYQEGSGDSAEYHIAEVMLLTDDEDDHEQRKGDKSYVIENKEKIVFSQIPIQPNLKGPIIQGELLNQTEDMIKVKYIDPK